jgi:hypothetical protein
MSIHGNRLDLQQIELPRFHQRAKPLVKNIGAVGFAA